MRGGMDWIFLPSLLIDYGAGIVKRLCECDMVIRGKLGTILNWLEHLVNNVNFYSEGLGHSDARGVGGAEVGAGLAIVAASTKADVVERTSHQGVVDGSVGGAEGGSSGALGAVGYAANGD